MSAQLSLLQSVQIGEIAAKNRIFMAPLTRCRAVADDAAPTALHATYYAQRASAGLIVTEATQICPEGKGYSGTPGIYSEAQEAGWKQVCDAVHAAGGKIIAQLWHVGRISHSSFQPDGRLPVAPSALAAPGKVVTAQGRLAPFEVPRALSLDEVRAIPAQYAQAARVAQRAGFDGVELHSANGYLLEQFIRDLANTRDDEYGGCVAGRNRLTLECLDALIGVFGKGRVGMRLSPVSTANCPQTGSVQESYMPIVEAANVRGIAFLHFIEGSTGRDRILDGFDFARARAMFSGAYIANNQYDNALAESAVAANAADAIAFGVPFISNPDLPERIAAGHPWAAANKAKFYVGGAEGYTDYPRFAQVAA